jgi:hypothetical protein
MNNPTDPLSQLIDIQLPATPAFWPPAPGWWIAVLVVLAVIFYLVKLWRAVQTRKRPVREFVQSLNSLSESTDDDPVSILSDISKLLRRYAIHKFGRETVANLHGDDWLRFLDKTTQSGMGFSQGCCHTLGDAMYQSNAKPNVKDIVSFLQSWAKGKS